MYEKLIIKELSEIRRTNILNAEKITKEIESIVCVTVKNGKALNEKIGSLNKLSKKDIINFMFAISTLILSVMLCVIYFKQLSVSIEENKVRTKIEYSKENNKVTGTILNGNAKYTEISYMPVFAITIVEYAEKENMYIVPNESKLMGVGNGWEIVESHVDSNTLGEISIGNINTEMQNEIDSLTTDYNDKYSCKIQLCYIIKSKYTDVLYPDQENTKYYFMWSDVVGQSKFKNLKMSYRTDELYEIQDYSEKKVNNIFSNQVSLWEIEGEERNSEKIYNWYNLSE